MYKTQYVIQQCIIVFLFIYAGDITFAQARMDIHWLRGIRGFNVIVDTNMKTDLAAKIESEVKGKLRLSGIEVDVNVADKYYPSLFVTAKLLKIRPGDIYAVAIGTRVLDLVVLEREGNIEYKGGSSTFYSADALPQPATTWHRDHFGALGKEVYLQEIRKTIRGYVDELIKDYLAANPR